MLILILILGLIVGKRLRKSLGPAGQVGNRAYTETSLPLVSALYACWALFLRLILGAAYTRVAAVATSCQDTAHFATTSKIPYLQPLAVYVVNANCTFCLPCDVQVPVRKMIRPRVLMMLHENASWPPGCNNAPLNYEKGRFECRLYGHGAWDSGTFATITPHLTSDLRLRLILFA